MRHFIRTNTVKRVRYAKQFSILVLGALFVSGCGDANKPPPLGSVVGVVTLDGKALANAEVSFSPINGGRPSSGNTDSEGKFELVFSDKEKGAIIGSHAVRITTVDPHTGARKKDGTLAPPAGEVVPAKYLKPNAIVKDVVAGKNSYSIELTTQ